MIQLKELFDSDKNIWALQLDSLKHVEGKYTKINFEPNGLIINSHLGDRFLWFTVLPYFSTLFKQQEHTNFFTNLLRLNEGDFVLGISKQSVCKIGIISLLKPVNNYRIVAKVIWIEDLEPIGGLKDIFDTDVILTKVPKEVFKTFFFSATQNYLSLSLLKPEDDNNSSFAESLGVLVAKLVEVLGITDQVAGIIRTAQTIDNKSETRKLVFNPESGELMIGQDHRISGPSNLIVNQIYKDGFFGGDPGGEITLFYGTTRLKTGNSAINNYYGSELSDLQLGSCKISIPPGHRQGEIERPKKILLWQRQENQDKHVILTSIEERIEDDFYSWLKMSVSNSESKAALIFVHGFNVTFAEAAWRTGQIVYDIPFNGGIAGFFSWPSVGETFEYSKDIERADASIPAFVEFIEGLVNNTGVENLHIIAHSMGSRILTVALNKLAARENFKNKLKTIRQIILAAPDLDKDVFSKSILPEFKSIGKRRTLYVSDKDLAMILSRKLRIGLERLGEAGDKIFVADGLDTVDASNVASEGINHSYIFETKELLTDLYLLISEDFEPQKRRLKSIPKEKLNYWLFPE